MPLIDKTNLSITKKLTATIVFSCLLVSLMASAFFIVSEIISLRKSVLEDLSGLAGVVGINCTAALEFNDPETAREILASLSAKPHILYAALFTHNSRLFASYGSAGIGPGEVQEIRQEIGNKILRMNEASYHFDSDHIELSQPVISSGKNIGTLILLADKNQFQAILIRLAMVVTAIITTTVLLAMLFSGLLNRRISRPILDLAATMEQIHRSKNFSIRALSHSEDELGVLVNGVNAMLDGIQQRDEQLRVAKENAEEANRAKSRFLAQMSHEIRTPMNGVLGMTALLRNTNLDAKQQKFVCTIRRSGKLLLKLINDILDFSKIEAGKLELEAIGFSVSALVEEVMELFHEQARHKGLTLSQWVAPEVPEMLKGDPGRLRQILMNLLSNGLKFTESGRISLKVTAMQKDKHQATLHFAVQDSGLGIAREQQEKIFAPFSQADGSTTRQFGGTGLGLAICQQLVRMMGGEIGVHSVAGKGSTFWFTITLPVATRQTGKQHPPPSASSKFEGVVLVAEDNPTNQIVAQGLLELLGCQVDTVANGQEAVQAATRNQYDLIFMDCQMPVMDGYTATREIRKTTAALSGKRVPIIALTAHAMKGDRQACLEAGMDDYLVKPYDEQQLAAVLSKWLSPAPGQTSTACCRPASRKGPQKPQAVTMPVDKSVLDGLRRLQLPDKPDIITSLITVYLEHSPSVVQGLRQAAETRQSEQLWQTAHSFKSSSANLGALRLARLCARLETMGREGQLQGTLEIVDALEKEYAQVAAFLKKMCRSAAQKDNGIVKNA